MSGPSLVSASQINLFRECQRKWGWSYIAKIKTPPNAAAQLGIDVDDNQLQPYLREGRPFDYTRESGYLAAAALAYLPQPMSPGLVVQKHFMMGSPSSTNFAYQGYIDLSLPDSAAMPGCEGGVPLVCDFKTTSNFKWAKTPEKLAVDVQAQLYAMHTLVDARVRSADLVWLYLQTKGPRKVKRVHLRVHADDVADQFAKIDATAAKMFEVRQTYEESGQSAEEYVGTLKPNASMCDAYGGCPYRSKCNLSPAEISASLAENFSQCVNQLTPLEELPMSSTVDLLASLKARKGGTSPTVVVAEQTPPEVPSPAAAPEPMPVASWAALDAPSGIKVADSEPATGSKVPLGINPPESKLPPAPFHAPAAPQEPVLAIEAKKRGRKPKEVKDVMAELVSETEALGGYDIGPVPSTVLLANFAQTMAEALTKLSEQLRASK